MNKNRSLKISLALSILFHLLLFALYQPFADLVLAPIGQQIDPQRDMVNQQPIVFELVETPDEPDADQPDQMTPYVSDKANLARDRVQETLSENGKPYREGRIDMPVFAGGGGISGSVEQNPSTDRQPVQKKDGVERADQAMLAEQNQGKDRTTPYQRFHASVLRGGEQSNPMKRNDYTDDVEMDNRKGSARAYGDIQLSTYNWEWAPYIEELRRKLRSNIHTPPAFYRLGMIEGETKLTFKIYPDGRFEDLQVLDYKGHSSLKTTSVNAVELSDPFIPLPSTFPEAYLELTWTFYYYIIR